MIVISMCCFFLLVFSSIVVVYLLLCVHSCCSIRFYFLCAFFFVWMWTGASCERERCTKATQEATSNDSTSALKHMTMAKVAELKRRSCGFVRCFVRFIFTPICKIDTLTLDRGRCPWCERNVLMRLWNKRMAGNAVLNASCASSTLDFFYHATGGEAINNAALIASQAVAC